MEYNILLDVVKLASWARHLSAGKRGLRMRSTFLIRHGHMFVQKGLRHVP